VVKSTIWSIGEIVGIFIVVRNYVINQCENLKITSIFGHKNNFIIIPFELEDTIIFYKNFNSADKIE